MAELDYLKHLSRSDDAAAVLDDMMRIYGPDVWRYAYFLTKRPDAADDISQDVFLKAYRKLSSFRGESSVRTWLLGIARHASLNYMRAAFFRKVTLVDRIHPKDHGPSAEHVAIERLQTERIWAMVLSLPAKYREILILDAHYECSEQEMADLLGISRGTVKSRLHRARAKVEKLRKGDDADA